MLSTLLQCSIVIVMQLKLDVVVVVVGLSNGGRSFTKNMHYWPSTITKGKKHENVKISSQ